MQDGTPLLRGVPAEDKPLLEHSLRLALMRLADAAARAEQPLMAYRHDGAAAASVPRLLDLAIWLSLHKQTEYPSKPPHPCCTSSLTTWLILLSWPRRICATNADSWGRQHACA